MLAIPFGNLSFLTLCVSNSDESAESVPGSGEDRKDSEPAEELERDESQGILHEKVNVLIFHSMHAQNVF